MRNIFMFFIILSNLAFSQDAGGNRPEKIYVQPNQISFEQNGIFVQVDNQWISVESVHADALGVYVTDDLRDLLHWTCPKCGHKNGLFSKRCKNCGY